MTATKETDDISVTFECQNCGASPCTLTIPDDYTDDSIAKCKSCGFEHGRWGDIKAKARALAQAELKRIVGDTAKRIKRSWGK